VCLLSIAAVANEPAAQTKWQCSTRITEILSLPLSAAFQISGLSTMKIKPVETGEGSNNTGNKK